MSDLVGHPNQNQQHKSNNTLLTIVVMVGIFIAIGVWYNNTHYNSTFQNNFMSNCETTNTAAGCGCAYGVLAANYDYSQAKAMDSNTTAGITTVDTQSYKALVANQCR
jgi:hypothetical protein